MNRDTAVSKPPPTPLDALLNELDERYGPPDPLTREWAGNELNRVEQLLFGRTTGSELDNSL